jgi:hypothetical protein
MRNSELKKSQEIIVDYTLIQICAKITMRRKNHDAFLNPLAGFLLPKIDMDCIMV